VLVNSNCSEPIEPCVTDRVGQCGLVDREILITRLRVQLIFLRLMLDHGLIAAARLTVNLFAGHIFILANPISETKRFPNCRAHHAETRRARTFQYWRPARASISASDENHDDRAIL
jgi:hypothetical protein